LIPRQLMENGLQDAPVTLTDSALSDMVRSYTYEAGVRNLEREIANVLRKVARRKPRASACRPASALRRCINTWPAAIHAAGGRAARRGGRGDRCRVDRSRRRHHAD